MSSDEVHNIAIERMCLLVFFPCCFVFLTITIQAAILGSYVIKGVSIDMVSGVGGGHCSESREEEEICIY